MLHEQDATVIKTVFGEGVLEQMNKVFGENEVKFDLNLGGRKLIDPDEYASKLNEIRGAGIEIGVKEIAKLAGITLNEGEKKPEVVAAKIKDSIKTQLEEQYKNPKPTEELERVMQSALDWKTKYEGLAQTHEAVLTEKEQLALTLDEKIKRMEEESENTMIMASIPKSVQIQTEYALTLVKAGVVADKDEDGNTVYRDRKTGKMYIDGASRPLTLDDTLKVFFEKAGLVPNAGGGAQQNQKPNNALGLTSEAAFKKIKDAGIDPMSQEGLKLYNEYTKK
jgi:hypothetical protein